MKSTAATGVSFAAYKKIIERHGGLIWVDSLAGEGRTFSFTLSKSAKLMAVS